MISESTQQHTRVTLALVFWATPLYITPRHNVPRPAEYDCLTKRFRAQNVPHIHKRSSRKRGRPSSISTPLPVKTRDMQAASLLSHARARGAAVPRQQQHHRNGGAWSNSKMPRVVRRAAPQNPDRSLEGFIEVRTHTAEKRDCAAAAVCSSLGGVSFALCGVLFHPPNGPVYMWPSAPQQALKAVICQFRNLSGSGDGWGACGMHTAGHTNHKTQARARALRDARATPAQRSAAQRGLAEHTPCVISAGGSRPISQCIVITPRARKT
jgi:hypothetical protein